MASPLTGCKEQDLVYIKTDKFDLTIKGKPCHPRAEALFSYRDKISTLSISCKDVFSVEVLDAGFEKQTISVDSESLVLPVIPLFFEQQNYQVVIENNSDSELSFWHDNINLREKVSYVGRNKRTLSGILNFGSEVGFSEMSILVDGTVYLTMAIEIFPSKLDYQKDYYTILADVTNEIYNLAFDFLKKTYLLAGRRENVGNSLTEFFSIINIIFKKFTAALDMVIKTPHHVLECESNIVKFNKIRRVNTSTIKWLEKHPDNIFIHEGRYIPSKALVMKKHISYDTFENRFVKYILKVIIKKLDNIKLNYSKLNRYKDEQVLRKIETMHSEIKRRLEFSFLSDVGDLSHLNSLSLVLNMAPGYKDIYKYYLMLLKGLSLNGQIFKISIKDLAVLYEYWCFIKINSILKNKYKLIRQDLIKVDSTGLFVTLVKGRNAQVTYENPKNGEKFTITYNPLITGIPTVSQKPDNILSLEKQRSRIKYEYIFDAKYRVNPALEGTNYQQTYKTPGPEEDDINTMHRYRDAIVSESAQKPDFERTVFGAFVLFPYTNEDEYQNHQFYTSINKVNVGGLPFLPSATKLVSDLLEDLIDDTPESAFERSTLPIGSYEFINAINFDDMNVLVGPLRNKAQLKVALDHGFYHMPYKNVGKKGISFKYIAIYQSVRDFGKDAGISYYGEIKQWEIVKRREITEIPRNSDELYVKFIVEEWKVLPNPIKPKEYGVRSHIYTNKHLLLNAEYLPELCIKSPEEYRLYLELKRVSDAVDIKASDRNLDDALLDSFVYNDVRISIENENIKVLKDGAMRTYSLKDFRNKPRTIMLRIKEFIDQYS